MRKAEFNQGWIFEDRERKRREQRWILEFEAIYGMNGDRMCLRIRRDCRRIRRVTMGEVAVEEKVRIFAGQVYAAAGIGMWCFSRNRRLFYSTSRNQSELLAFLELSDCWDYIFQREQGWENPLILSDSLHMVWIAHDVVGETGRNYLLLLGPVFPSRVSIHHIHEALEKRESSVQMQRQLIRILSDVPVQSMEVLRQYARMLHYSVTEEMISVDEIYLQESEPRIHQKERTGVGGKHGKTGFRRPLAAGGKAPSKSSEGGEPGL